MFVVSVGALEPPPDRVPKTWNVLVAELPRVSVADGE
jgi:hypothetical protein